MNARWITIAGVLILAAGVSVIKTTDEWQGLAGALPYICIGLGAGLFGHGMGKLMSSFAKKHSPAAAKQVEIEQNDERNLAIAYRAKAKAYDLMVPVLGALLTALALMGLELTMLLLLAAAYTFIIGCSVYYRVKYSKEM
ncbi:hypothetical protein [Paenibacillus sp. PL2-23]|uniref:hypothetical protein n=1 Tax=Paenibacillus sp. PL2-23 TaxID=2100729 RepID=UPI0030FA1826